jgi:sugar/nucleoside kinase (ribokinase family)
VDVVCLGIVVVDVICRPVDDLPERGTVGLVEEVVLQGGGCALSTASALVRLGLEAAVAGKVGADRFGDFLVDLLDERGVDRRGVVRDSEAPTSASVALVGSDGARTFLHVPGANGTLRADELDLDLVYAGRALHVAGELVMPGLDGEPFAELLEGARGRGIVTSVDTVFDASGRWDRVLPSLAHVDLFTPSIDEARAISGEVDPARAAAWLRSCGAEAVAVTLGEDGCYGSGPGFEGYMAAPRVEAVDGTGAGDAFAAGLLYGTLAGWSFERAVRFGCAAGALATTAVGAYDGVGRIDETLALAGLAAGAA